MAVYNNLDGTMKNELSIGKSNKVKFENSSGKLNIKTADTTRLSIDKTTGDLSIPGGEYIYLRGDATTDGSVRHSSQSYGTQIFERREAGQWVILHTDALVGPGVLNQPAITDNGNGTINVGSIYAALCGAPSWVGILTKYPVAAANNLSLTDNSVNYLIVDYNAGIPVYAVTTNPADINGSSKVLAANMYREGTIIYFIPVSWGLSPASRINDRLINTFRFERSSGLTLSETTINGTARCVSVSAGVVWYGANAFSKSQADSLVTGVSKMFQYTVTNGTWSKTLVSQYNNSQYNPSTGPATADNNKYLVNWVYRFIDGSSNPTLAIVLDASQYNTLNDAGHSTPPNTPVILQRQTILVGRIIVQHSAATASQIDSAFTQVFAATPISSHNNLGGLQGGAVNEYYHMTSAEWTEQTKFKQFLSGFSNRTDSVISMNGSDFEITPATTSYDIFSNGTKYTKNALLSVSITNDQTLHYVYFSELGVLTVDTTPWDLLADTVQVATVFKDGSNYAVNDERHAAGGNREWHKWAHDTIGARYETGLEGTFTDTTLSITQGTFANEDLNFDTISTQTSTRIWYRGTGGSGMKLATVSTTPYMASGGVLKYDDLGTLTDVTNNNYSCSYIYAAPDPLYPIYCIMGQDTYSNLTAARNAGAPAINLTEASWKLLYKVIYRQENGGIVYVETVDYRLVTTGPATMAAILSHASLTGRDNANSHPQSAITGLTTSDSPSFAGLDITNGGYIYLRGDATTDGSIRCSSQSSGVYLIEKYVTDTWVPWHDSHNSLDTLQGGTTDEYYHLTSAELTSLSNMAQFPASSAQGDILYNDGSSWTRLPAGAAGQVLGTQGASADPQWISAAGGLEAKAEDYAANLTNAGKMWMRTDASTSIAKAVITSATDSYSVKSLLLADPTVISGMARFSSSGLLTAATTDIDQICLDTNFTSGILNRSESTMSFNSSNTTFTITPTGTSFSIYIRGVKYQKTENSIDISTASGFATNRLVFVYYNSSGVLTASTSYWGAGAAVAPLAAIFWNGSTGVIGEARHSAARNLVWSDYLHTNIGTQWSSGFLATFTSSDMTVGTGTIASQDISITISQQTSARIWVGASTGEFTFYDSPASTAALISAGALKYSDGGIVTSVSDGYYVKNYVYATVLQTYPIAVVVGFGEYTNISDCRSAEFPDYPNMGDVKQDQKLLYATIWKNNGGTPELIETIDYRSAPTQPNSTLAKTPIYLDDLLDVAAAAPSLDQVLRWNGSNWTNGASMSASAGSGVSFYNATPTITATGDDNDISIMTLSKIPITTTEQSTTATISSNTIVTGARAYPSALNRTTIDAGIWTFTIYGKVDSVADGRITSMSRAVYSIVDGDNASVTVTITGSGTSRTATASGGTPFATTKITASSTNTEASYLQTPKGIYQITARTSNTEVTILVPSTYTNESAVSLSVWKQLFLADGPIVSSTDVKPYTWSTGQAAFTISITTRLGALSFATSNNTTVLTTYHNGTEHNSNFLSPLSVLHNDITGLQGGSSNSYYHLTSTQYSNLPNQALNTTSSPTFVATTTDSISEKTTGAGVTINGLKVSDITLETPTSSDVGKLRYHVSGNNSYCDMVMQISATDYAWVNIMISSW